MLERTPESNDIEDKVFRIINAHGIEIEIKIENGIVTSYEKRNEETKYLPQNGIDLNGLGSLIEFKFVILDDKEVLKIGTEYMNYHFLENGNQYIPKNKPLFDVNEIKEGILNYIQILLEKGFDKLKLNKIFPKDTNNK